MRARDASELNSNVPNIYIRRDNPSPALDATLIHWEFLRFAVTNSSTSASLSNRHSDA